MVTVLYTFDRGFMRKTVEAIDRHVDAPSAYLPLGQGAVGASDRVREIDVDPDDPAAVDRTVADLDPDVVVRNHTFHPGAFAFEREYPIVHCRHGASIGRDEVRTTIDRLRGTLDVALAPGERWAARYREGFPSNVEIVTVGVPEADDLVGAEPPREGRVLYAPTNHNYGGGTFLATAEHVVDVFEDSSFELLFRPHPMDRLEEPGRSVTERCRRRIEGAENMTFDDSETPRRSLEAADVLVSDCSGIVTEWLHTDRPLIQLTAVADPETRVPELGYVTDELTIELVADLYDNGEPESVTRRREAAVTDLGVPMDGRAGERAAEVVTCTP